MSNATPPNLFLNVFINKEKTKVLFAEARGDLINVLLSFLTLPLGKIVAILQKHNGSAAIGSLTTLYKGLSELDTSHFSTPAAKQMLLNPRSSFDAQCRKLAFDLADTAPLRYFLCEDVKCPINADSKYASTNICMYSDIAKCACGRSFNRELSIAEHRDEAGAFVFSPLYFIIFDDLRVEPILKFEALTDLGITDTQGAEMRTLSLGFHEFCELLKLSLTSATPLTDMVLRKNTVQNPHFWCWVSAAIDSRKMDLRAFLHKSTNKFLFAEATDEFVELLFSFLTVPLCGVEFLLSNNTPLKNIDNLYSSLLYADDLLFVNIDTQNILTKPKLPHGYLSKNQLLPLSEEGPPKLYYKEKRFQTLENGVWKSWYECSFHEKRGTMVPSFKSRKEAYAKKHTMCFVSDDLTMSPCLASRISILNDVGIHPSDVKETELHIGRNEALGILKASLI
ncbi:hypothetical protein AAHA92_10969 [Salvia divinorum]|uniref:Uncharacterized protein n=1 Tax=Salvia divinorum TaxID=28513 RepID=A0ABD1HWG8_SALDI